MRLLSRTVPIMLAALVLAPLAARAASWTMYGQTLSNSFAATEKYLRTADVHSIVPLWQTLVGKTVTATPLVVDSTVYVGLVSTGGGIRALRLRTGALIWADSLTSKIYGTPVYANGSIYVGFLSGRVNR